MSSFSSNLERLMNKRDMNDSELAELVDVNRTTVTRWRKGIRSPKLDKLPEIANVFGVKPLDLIHEIDASKIIEEIHNVSSQLTPPRQQNVLNYANSQLDEQNKVTSIDEYKESKLVSYIACGATGAGIGEELYDDILHEEVFFKEDEAPSNADFCILINGDSMEPMLKQGTYAFIKKEDSIKDGTIALVVLDGVSLIKRVDICEDYINLVSLNPKYDDIKVASFSDIKVMGKVVL
ncbi:TPA: helix-turn-helix domain-containing protein [Staphylococcus aureus]